MSNNEKKYKWVPSDDSVLSGHVTLRVPTFNERFEYMEYSQFDIGPGEEQSTKIKQLCALRKLVDLSNKHYLEVCLKKKEDSSEIKSFDEMSLDADCDQALIEIAGLIMNGFKIPKK